MSFMFFSVSAISDYLFHSPLYSLYNNSILRLLIGGGFFAGLITLLIPMFYLRSITRGDRTWANADPPDWGYAIVIASFTGYLTWVAVLRSSAPNLLGFAWLIVAFLAMLGGWWVLRYWQGGNKLRAGFVLMFLPVILALALDFL